MPSPDGEAPYPEVPTQADYPSLEGEILDFWAADATFEASVKLRAGGDNEYVFYDGPPFANGLPHYGHLLTGFVKDAVPRYQTMRGRRVERRFGWDCHGLPAEMEAERELGVAGRSAIINDFGVGRFNEYCRCLVQRTTDQWEHYVTRQARWVDFTNDYKTMDLSYMESVMWAFKQLHDKGLAYEGYRVLPYCWECETPLSNFETRMDDSYRQRQDPAVTVLFDLEPAPGEAGPLRVLVWTTTPWTLPSNLALAVGPDIEYRVFERGGERFLVGAGRAEAYLEQLEGATEVATVRGAELVGRTYRPLFDFFASHPGAFRVLPAGFVTTEEGTGIVHIAPGFGEDDQRLCDEYGISVVAPVDDRGCFTAEVPPYAGQQVFEANRSVIADLRAQGVLLRHDSYVHSYPHCWRTDTPLIYKAVSSWFVRVTQFKDRMLELNQTITWIPEHVRDGAFGKWLEGARDWSISRNRFWGAPIPVWKSDDPRYPRIDVYGSLDELEADFGVRPTDLHRPAIDELTRPNPDDPTGASTMRRVEDVLDCWFESGSMTFAQVHYPFENRQWFESHFPADFIVEYIGQTRGWFYTLHVLATALFDCPPFRTCMAHGIVLGDDGQKLSKRLKNYPDPEEVFATYGADAMRWFLLSSPVLRGGDLVVERRGVGDAVRQALNPVWNAWHFFSLYANIDNHRGRWRTDAAGVLDRYILAKTRQLVVDLTAAMDAYDLSGSCGLVTAFLDALNNWYIRRSRDRFWRPVAGESSADRDKADAYDTLYTALHTLCRVAAPLMPLLTEAVFKGLTGDRSVHLVDWPDPSELPADPELVAAMDRVREVCSSGLSVRKAANLRVRLPLGSLTVTAPWAEDLTPFVSLIAEEVNVKEVHLSTAVSDVADHVLQVSPAVLGPRLGPATQQVLAAVRRGEWTRDASGSVRVGERILQDDEYTLRLAPRHESTSRALPGDDGLVTLDVTVTPELEAEGAARDVVRLVQQARKEEGLHVSDRIRLMLDLPDDVAAAVRTHEESVKSETLAEELILDVALTEARRGELPDGRAVHIGIAPVRG
ncbi:MAG TPA: isoleucine--tRNA ligase [Acidimicrobiales bacterium]|nr:isoleucine--tRNA ligase [Acidimicrobiales bacterium]